MKKSIIYMISSVSLLMCSSQTFASSSVLGGFLEYINGYVYGPKQPNPIQTPLTHKVEEKDYAENDFELLGHDCHHKPCENDFELLGHDRHHKPCENDFELLGHDRQNPSSLKGSRKSSVELVEGEAQSQDCVLYNLIEKKIKELSSQKTHGRLLSSYSEYEIARIFGYRSVEDMMEKTISFDRLLPKILGLSNKKCKELVEKVERNSDKKKPISS